MTKRSRNPGNPLSSWKFPTRSRIVESFRSIPVQNRESFYRTIRFRLTAWYAAVLIIVIFTISVAISTSVSRALERATDDQLFLVADDIAQRTDVQATDPASSDQSLDANVEAWPDVSEFLLAGFWIQYINRDETLEDVEEIAVTANIAFPEDLMLQTPYREVVQTGSTQVQTVRNDEIEARTIVVPLRVLVDGAEITVGAVAIGTSLETQNSTLDVVNQIARLSGIFGVIVATWAGWIVAGQALSPVKRIAGAAENIARQPSSPESLAIRIDVPNSGDEVSHLASTFNTMLQRIEEAFAVQRRFVADASHELRTPLTAIRGNVDVLLRQAKSKRPIDNAILLESLDDVRRESGRMSRLIDDLLTLARDDARAGNETIRNVSVPLDELVQDACDTLDPLATDRELILDVSDRVTVVGDPDRLTQVMIILGENALRYTPANGSVTLSVSRTTLGDSNLEYATFSVRDTGPGISDAHLPHIFERFYRASGARERGSGGNGLGLAIALGIVRAHGGWIDVETAPTRGSTFTVFLPRNRIDQE
ncbi:MAG: ATP-binding protein [Thermomicrobiales bacterium]